MRALRGGAGSPKHIVSLIKNKTAGVLFQGSGGAKSNQLSDLQERSRPIGNLAQDGENIKHRERACQS